MELIEKPLASGDKKVYRLNYACIERLQAEAPYSQCHTIGRLRGTKTWRRIDVRLAAQESYQ
jgi:hypothetical protein